MSNKQLVNNKDSEAEDLTTISYLRLDDSKQQVHMKSKIGDVCHQHAHLALVDDHVRHLLLQTSLLRDEPHGEPGHHAGADDHLHKRDRGAASNAADQDDPHLADLQQGR